VLRRQLDEAEASSIASGRMNRSSVVALAPPRIGQPCKDARKESMMSTSMLLDRTQFAGLKFGTVASPSVSPAPSSNWCVLPRCEIRFEKCSGGIKIHCDCEDEVACGALQNLCRMMCDGLCTCTCTCNGMPICQVNLTMGICSCEYTTQGVCIRCLSGDERCCAMLQACCDALQNCCQAGCYCFVSFNNTQI